MALTNNALASSRRMRHQNKLGKDQIEPCFFCGRFEDSLSHIYLDCVVVYLARKKFFGSLGLTFFSSATFLPAPDLSQPAFPSSLSISRISVPSLPLSSSSLSSLSHSSSHSLTVSSLSSLSAQTHTHSPLSSPASLPLLSQNVLSSCSPSHSSVFCPSSSSTSLASLSLSVPSVSSLSPLLPYSLSFSSDSLLSVPSSRTSRFVFSSDSVLSQPRAHSALSPLSNVSPSSLSSDLPTVSCLPSSSNSQFSLPSSVSSLSTLSSHAHTRSPPSSPSSLPLVSKSILSTFSPSLSSVLCLPSSFPPFSLPLAVPSLPSLFPPLSVPSQRTMRFYFSSASVSSHTTPITPTPTPKRTSTAALRRESVTSSTSNTSTATSCPTPQQKAYDSISRILHFKDFRPNFPLLATYLIDCPSDYVAPILAFNYAVWKFRQPAQASIAVESLDWLLSRITEHARAQLAFIKKPVRKSKKSVDPDFIEKETVVHNGIVSTNVPNIVFCYTDGSASPNPGPSGAGACIFMPHIDTVIDLGASLGKGTNNTGELYALGMLLTHLIYIKKHSFSSLSSAFIFSDSKLAIAAASSKKPTSNITLSLAVMRAHSDLSKLIKVELHWIRGHAGIGGNERVDRISKRFASIDNNSAKVSFDRQFRAHISQAAWPFGANLTNLPTPYFLMRLPTPPSILLASEHDFKHSIAFDSPGIGRFFRQPDTVSRFDSSLDVTSALQERRPTPFFSNDFSMVESSISLDSNVQPSGSSRASRKRARNGLDYCSFPASISCMPQQSGSTHFFSNGGDCRAVESKQLDFSLESDTQSTQSTHALRKRPRTASLNVSFTPLRRSTRIAAKSSLGGTSAAFL